MTFAPMTQDRGNTTGETGLLRGGHLIAGIEVSVLTSESHSYTATPTKLTLESGSVVTDHVMINPDSLSIVFAMSNAGEGANGAARDVLESFKKMMTEVELLEVVTEHYVYSDMVITSISPEHRAPYRGALIVTLTLDKINFVELRSVGRQPAKLGGKAKKTGAGAEEGGQVDPKQVEGTALEKTLGTWGVFD